MFAGRIFRIMLVLLLVFGLFGIASTSLYRAGWSQGFAAAQVADGAEEGAPPPHPYYGPGRGFGPGWGFFPFFGLLGGLLKFFLFFFLLGLIFKTIGFFFWRKGGRRGKHWHWHHSHKPPWDGEPADESVMKA